MSVTDSLRLGVYLTVNNNYNHYHGRDVTARRNYHSVNVSDSQSVAMTMSMALVDAKIGTDTVGVA